MTRLFISALLASVAAGIPDVFAAAALSRSPPGRILQTIASGLSSEDRVIKLASAELLDGQSVDVTP